MRSLRLYKDRWRPHPLQGCCERGAAACSYRSQADSLLFFFTTFLLSLILTTHSVSACYRSSPESHRKHLCFPLHLSHAAPLHRHLLFAFASWPADAVRYFDHPLTYFSYHGIPTPDPLPGGTGNCTVSFHPLLTDSYLLC